MSWRNRYFALRHGESEANVAQRIVSHPASGLSQCGLTERGREQASSVAQVIRQWPAGSWDLYASDFARTRQTAEYVQNESGGDVPIQFVPELRERYFGSLEGCSTRRYADVWHADASGAPLPTDVEPAADVLARALQLVNQIESSRAERRILLVAHGDVLQILATAFLGLAPQRHRQMSPLHPAELRELTLPG